MHTPTTCALIGTGMVAATHLAAIRDAQPPVRLAGVLARSDRSARAFAASASAQLGYEVGVYDSIAAVAASDVDFAIIVTPPDARMALVAPLAKAGKAILLEKPLGRDSTEAAALVQGCADAGVPLGVLFQHRMRAASLAAARLVASGTLGTLGLVEITVPWWRPQSYYDEPGRGTYARDGGGVLISQAIHTLDLALSLTGPVTHVHAMCATTRFHQMEAEDFVSAGLRFANGAVGSLVASTASFPGGAETITLHHDHATLRLGEGIAHVHWRDGRTQTHGTTASTGGGADPMAFTHAWHQSVLEDFVSALHENRPPAITGADALAAHRLIDALVQSGRDSRAVAVPT